MVLKKVEQRRRRRKSASNTVETEHNVDCEEDEEEAMEDEKATWSLSPVRTESRNEAMAPVLVCGAGRRRRNVNGEWSDTDNY